VTFPRPAGIVPARPNLLDRRVKRAGLFAGAGVLAALNAQASPIIDAFTYLPSADAIAGLAGISAVIWLAMYAALKIGLENHARPLTRRDALVLSATALLAVIPLSLSAKAGLLLCASYLFATSRAGDPSCRVSLILLALTGPLVWGRILLQLFAAPILALDARLVGLATGTAVDGNTVRFVGQNGRMLIGGPCSSVHNISLAIVLWTTAAVLFSLRVDRRYMMIGVAMVAWMFGLNIARLALIGLFPANYIFLHHGAGAAMFGWAGLIGAALLAGMGVLRAAARQR